MFISKEALHALEMQIATLRRQVSDFQMYAAEYNRNATETRRAFDEFFDAIAPEFGYRAAHDKDTRIPGTTVTFEGPVLSPRRFAMTTPVVLRTTKIRRANADK